MSEPHAGGNAFARDIPQHSENTRSVLRQGGEVPGEKARGEYFAGKLQVPIAQHARSAQLALNLGGIEHLRMQICSFPQQGINILLQRHL